MPGERCRHVDAINHAAFTSVSLHRKYFEGVGFVDGAAPETVAFEIDRISAYQIDER